MRGAARALFQEEQGRCSSKKWVALAEAGDPCWSAASAATIGRG